MLFHSAKCLGIINVWYLKKGFYLGAIPCQALFVQIIRIVIRMASADPAVYISTYSRHSHFL